MPSRRWTATWPPIALAMLALALGLTSPAEPAAAGPVAAPVVEIGMYTEGGQLHYFDPVGVWMEPGTTIRFVLRSSVHTATAYHPRVSSLNRVPEGAQAWDSGMLSRPGEAFEVTLDVEGVYDYFCLPHVFFGMVGRIIVGDPSKGPAAPLEEIPYPLARKALPTVEEILELGVVRFSPERLH